MNYYRIKDGRIFESYNFNPNEEMDEDGNYIIKFPDIQVTDKEIVHGYDGELYLEGEQPTPPEMPEVPDPWEFLNGVMEVYCD